MPRRRVPPATYTFEILPKNEAAAQRYLESLAGAIGENPPDAFGPPPHDLAEYERIFLDLRTMTITGTDQQGDIQAG